MHVKELFNIRGKVAVVTGAAGQLGYQLAIALNEAGSNVVLADLMLDVCEERARRLSEAGPEAIAVTLDVTNKQSVEEMADRIVSKFGKIDILVNNAGIACFTPFEERTIDDFQRVIDVNLKGVFLCSQVVSRYMEKRKSGVIINIGSIYGVVAADQGIYGCSGRNSSEVYAATKAGVIQITKYLASYLAKNNIRVNCISPGGVFNNQDPAFVRNYCDRTPLGRMGADTDLKGAVVYLASDASAYVTGHNLIVDGGWTIR